MFNQTCKEVAKHYKVSPLTVRRWVDTGTLKYGTQYIDIRPTNAKQAQLRFNLEAMDNLFAIPPEKR
jgi:transposase